MSILLPKFGAVQFMSSHCWRGLWKTDGEYLINCQ